MTFTSICYQQLCLLLLFLNIISISVNKESQSIQDSIELIESHFNGTILNSVTIYDDDLNIEFTISNIRLIMTYLSSSITQEPFVMRKYFNVNIYLLFDLKLRFEFNRIYYEYYLIYFWSLPLPY